MTVCTCVEASIFSLMLKALFIGNMSKREFWSYLEILYHRAKELGAGWG